MPPRIPSTAFTLCFLVAAHLASAKPEMAGEWFSIKDKPDFADVAEQLQVVVDEHAIQPNNRFCVVGERAGRLIEAWVYWPGDNKLILWLPDRDNPHAIAGSKRYLDLTRDVVDGADVHGSTYKLTRATANQKISACKERGDTFTIEKTARSGGHG